MQITQTNNTASATWVVSWREHGKPRARVFRTRAHADAFVAQRTREPQLGSDSPHDRGSITLDEFFEEWKRGHGMHLARSTQADYAATWDRHVSALLGSYSLSEISRRPELVQQFRIDLAQVTGAPTVRRTLMILQGVLQRAIEWNRIRYNPVAAVRKPSVERVRAVHPLLPEQVEQAIALLRAQSRHRDATLIATLAYAGLRPGEALALGWRHVRSRTLLIEASVSDGKISPTKTRKIRSVQLMPALADDLAAWRARQAARPPCDLIFPRSDGSYWTSSDWRNWRARVFVPAMRAAGIDCRRPYDLRHSFCSLLIQEGRSVVEVAQQMGHAPEMTLSTYAHVFAEAADPIDRLTAAEQVARVRASRLDPAQAESDRE